ncbi:MAG: hypothetical protein ABR520_00550 [Mycobacteriales bacterium]|nr:hypothetical protein [Frankia sp.]
MTTLAPDGTAESWTPSPADEDSALPTSAPRLETAAHGTDRLRYYGLLVLGLAVLLGIGGVAGLLLTREPRAW